MKYAVVLSGGTGSRLGLDIPKQYYEVAGRPVVSYVLGTLLAYRELAGMVVVADEAWKNLIRAELADYPGKLGFAEPGANRQLSIYHALLALREQMGIADEDVVLIQDAARPNTSLLQISKCFEETEEHDGVVPVLPMKDTVYLSENGKTVTSLLKRSSVFAGQAPEAFRYGAYLKANEALMPEQILTINGSTEPAVLAGMDIAMIPGDEHNYKITTQADLERFCSEKGDGSDSEQLRKR
jgi:2-C-methyl-D-erythritol 4-phosphate cytidylyltransferase